VKICAAVAVAFMATMTVLALVEPTS
jgi:hypothetical protein